MTLTTASTPTTASWWKRRTGLIVSVVMLLISIVLFIGTATMTVPSTATFPGPQMFPLIIATGTLILTLLLAIDVIRHPEPQYTRIQATAKGIQVGRTQTVSTVSAAGLDEIAFDADDDTPLRPKSNRRAVLGVVGTLLVFIAALQPVGWLISCAILFWGVARSLGSKHPVADIFIAFAISALVQLAFSAGLGLYLPPGILEGSVSWIR